MESNIDRLIVHPSSLYPWFMEVMVLLLALVKSVCNSEYQLLPSAITDVSR